MEPYGLTIASRGTLRQQASLAVSAPLKLNVRRHATLALGDLRTHFRKLLLGPRFRFSQCLIRAAVSDQGAPGTIYAEPDTALAQRESLHMHIRGARHHGVALQKLGSDSNFRALAIEQRACCARRRPYSKTPFHAEPTRASSSFYQSITPENAAA